MSQILDNAQGQIEQKLSAGDRRLLPTEIPWRYNSETLRIEAQLTGWSWKLLNNTIEGLRHCLYQEGIFREVFVNQVIDPEAPPGNRFMYLLSQRSKGLTGPIAYDPPDICENPETKTLLLYELGDNIGAYNMQQILSGALRELTSRIVVQGDRRISIVPWAFLRDGLELVAYSDGWSWQVLKNAVSTLQVCLFRQGRFNEVTVFEAGDPIALSGKRHLILKKAKADSPQYDHAKHK
ncbi:MAG: hypothetical protein L6R41_007118 [Letrouitia leprolyta]|nr:MAG: hypothetical protein L6R41_007118 [Letrouitia leprolyta]